MPAIAKTWTVLPHGPLINVADNIMTVEGDLRMPFGTSHRRMTIIRMIDGRLIIWSAIALGEPQMKNIERFGRPAFLVVPNAHHRMDAGIWKARYPALRVIAPEGARASVAKIVPVDLTGGEFVDPDVHFVTVPGTRQREAALEVVNPNGVSLVLSDIVANIRDAHGISGWIFGFFGFAGDRPQVPLTSRMMLIDDKKAVAAQMLRWAGIENLRRIIVGHGEIIADDPRGVLRRLSAQLAA
jgi:hypothetical protein